MSIDYCDECDKLKQLCRGHWNKDQFDREQKDSRRRESEGWVRVWDGSGTDGLWKKNE